MSELTMVMMEGTPGAGKSTLAAGLVGALGSRSFLFGEDTVFEIPEFAEVAMAFRTKHFPDPAMMLAAYATFIDNWRSDIDAIIFDWSCVGMIEDLPCAQYDRTSVTTQHPEIRADLEVLTAHAHDVAGLADRALFFVLDVPIATSIGRAHAERGEGWFAGWEGIKDLRGDGPFLDAAVRYWETAAPRYQDCVEAHKTGGWEIVLLDASATIDRVLEDALLTLSYGKG